MVGRRGARRTGRRTARRTSRRVSRRQADMNQLAPAPAAEPAPPPPPAPEEDKYAKLKEAKDLLDAGVLTDEEFAAEKKKILG